MLLGLIWKLKIEIQNGRFVYKRKKEKVLLAFFHPFHSFKSSVISSVISVVSVQFHRQALCRVCAPFWFQSWFCGFVHDPAFSLKAPVYWCFVLPDYDFSFRLCLEGSDLLSWIRFPFLTPPRSLCFVFVPSSVFLSLTPLQVSPWSLEKDAVDVRHLHGLCCKHAHSVSSFYCFT